MLEPTAAITLGEAPPSVGDLEIIFDLAPISLQANSKTKSAFIESVKAITKTAQYLLTGDVAIHVEWMIHEKNRYETDRAPDVDNILKPLIDALCGPDGLFVDDNQVQHISCSWIDWTKEDNERLLIRLQFEPDLWIPKSSLYFVRFGNSLCLPMRSDFQNEAQLLVLSTFEMMLSARDTLLNQGADYYEAKGVLPIQRFFHRSRLKGFPVLEAKELRGNLANS